MGEPVVKQGRTPDLKGGVVPMRQIKLLLGKEGDTAVLGAAVAQVLTPGMCIFLCGDLGSGKTTLVRAALKALGHTESVKSPTYALAEEYTLSRAGKPLKLVHFDLFRLETPDELREAGLHEYFGNETVCLVEWPERALSLLPSPDIRIYFYVVGMGRRATLHADTETGAEALARLRVDFGD